MLSQQEMIATVRRLSAQDDALVAVVMYGSFARGEGDEFSDIEFYLFVDDTAYPSFDLPAWIGNIAPVLECFENEFGTTVALFANLVRGEFHVCPASTTSQVRDWVDNVWVDDPDSMIILDRTGELREHLAGLVGAGPDRTKPKDIALLCRRFLDWMVFGTNVFRRGEHARALDILWFLQRYLLWMIRIAEKSTEHFPTPSKNLEEDITPEAYRRYVTCTAMLDTESLRCAYAESWSWGQELLATLSASCEVAEPKDAIRKLNDRLSKWGLDGKP